MGYKEILNDIKNNSLKNVYLFYGEETYLIDFCIQTIKEKYIKPSFETLNFISIDGKQVDANEVSNAAETLPFMSDKKIVVVNNPLWFSNKAKAEDIEEISHYIEKPSNSTILIFVLTSESIDKRKKVFKTIKKNNGTIEFSKIKGSELERWIKKEFKSKNKIIDESSIDKIIDLTGYLNNNNEITLYDLKNEIQKIINYIGQNEKVEEKTIEKVLIKSLQANIFELVDMLGEMRFDKAISVFNTMILNNEPCALIIHMITRQFRLLLMARILEAKGYSIGELAKKMKVPNFVARKTVNKSKNFSIIELKNSLEQCILTDRDIKKGKIEQILGVEMLIMNMKQ